MFRARRLNLLTFFLTLSAGLLCVSIFDLAEKRSSHEPKTKQPALDAYEAVPAKSKKAPITLAEQHLAQLQPGFCNDPAIKPIWYAIRRDKEVKEALDDKTSTPDCRDIFEVRYVDLNRDGKKEILARVLSVPFCGAVGNCDLFVLQQTKKGLRLLLHADDYIDATEMGEQVLRTRTNGFSDILTKGHFSAAETSHTTYKFDGRKYIETTCKYSVPTRHDGDKVTWGFISCKEFARRLDRELGKQ